MNSIEMIAILRSLAIVVFYEGSVFTAFSGFLMVLQRWVSGGRIHFSLFISPLIKRWNNPFFYINPF